jgi:hypothetical protein
MKHSNQFNMAQFTYNMEILQSLPHIEWGQTIGSLHIQEDMRRGTITQETLENRLVEEAYKQQQHRNMKGKTQEEQLVVVLNIEKVKKEFKRALAKERKATREVPF